MTNAESVTNAEKALQEARERLEVSRNYLKFCLHQRIREVVLEAYPRAGQLLLKREVNEDLYQELAVVRILDSGVTVLAEHNQYVDEDLERLEESVLDDLLIELNDVTPGPHGEEFTLYVRERQDG